LSHLSNVGRSPNTQKAYATDLKDYFQFLDQQQIDWRTPSLEVIGEWTAWLRSPTDAAKTVVALSPRRPRCGPATVSRKLSAVSAFYEFHVRHGLDLGRLEPMRQAWDGRRTGGSWKPFLTDIGPPRQRRRQIHAVAEGNGQFRMVQTNTTVLHKLDRIIDQLTEGDP